MCQAKTLRREAIRLRVASLYWLWIVALALLLPSFAQGNTVIRHYGTHDGMPVGSAESMQIDADGFLWLGTHDGLTRFDGRNFDTFDIARTPDLGSNRIAGLYKGPLGSLYALGSEGEWLQIGRHGIARIQLDGEQSAVRYVWSEPGALCVTLRRALYCEQAAGFAVHTRFAAGQDVLAAIPDGDAVWLILRGVGIVHVASGHTTLALDLPTLRQLPVKAGGARGKQGQLWLDLPDGVIELRREADSRWVAHDPDHVVIVVQLRVDADDQLYVGTDAGLFRTVGEQIEWLSQTAPGSAESQSWRGPDGALWSAYAGQLKREGKILLQSRGEINELLFYRDMVWISTNRDGIYALSEARVATPDDALLRSSNTYGVWVSPSDEVWVGSQGQGLFRIDPSGATHHYGPEQGLPGQFSWVVAGSPADQVYVATMSPGLWQLDRRNTQFLNVALPESLARAMVLSLSFDRHAQLWVGSTDGAWQRTAEGWRKRWPLSGSARVMAVLHARDGAQWIGSDRGLVRLSDAGESQFAADLLGSAAVRTVVETRDGSIWAASEGSGLIVLPKGADTTVRRLGRNEGLPSNSPHALVEDAAGNLWVNSNHGIFRIAAANIRAFLAGDIARLSPLVLGFADGVEELEGNGGVQPSSGLDSSGRVWFPTQRGVVYFDPASLFNARPAPEPIIERLSAAGRDFTDAQVAPIALGVRALEIHYNAANLQSGLIRYRYRLQPNQAEWTDAGTREVAAFAALAPGDYRFEVQAGNSDGSWSEAPATMRFTIAAYWYETATARVAGVIAIALFGLALAQVRLHQLRARTRQLNQIVQVRTSELRTEKSRAEDALVELAQVHSALSDSHEGIVSRNQRLAEQASRLEALDHFRTRLLADVSHELRTPLMLIKLPLEELLNRGKHALGADRGLVELARDHTGRLSKLVEQLVSLVQAEAQQLALRAVRLNLNHLLRRSVESFAVAAAANKVSVSLQCDTLPPIYGDPLHLSTVINNLIDNACKYAPPGSAVEVRSVLSSDLETVRISVRDRGPGFPADVAERLFERFFRGDGPPRAGREGLGIGLALARDLVLLHGGSIGAECTADSGTCFWFELALGSAHIALDDLVLDATASAVPVATPVAEAGSGPRILLVEDHPELANFLITRLADHYEVVWADNAETAWVTLQTEQIDVVVSDVRLPGQSGVELCARIKQEPTLSARPVILMSAKTDAADQASGLAAGALEWLAKPFSFDALLSSIARAYAPMRRAGDTSDADRVLAHALLHLPDAAFGTTQWADSVHLSERQLRRRVNELTGTSPVSWLREQRLVRVRDLIRSGECKTLAQAGAKSGIENPSYLYRLYRARFGES